MEQSKNDCNELEKPSQPEETTQNEYLMKCINNLVKSLGDRPGSCKKLQRGFPEFYEKNPEAVQVISDMMWKNFKENLHKSLDELTVHLDLKAKLDGLEGGTTEGTWRPSGKATEDVKAHVALAKMNEIHNLRSEIEKEEAEIRILRDTANMKKKMFEQKLLKLNSALSEWEAASQICSSNKENLVQMQQARKYGNSRY